MVNNNFKRTAAKELVTLLVSNNNVFSVYEKYEYYGCGRVKTTEARVERVSNDDIPKTSTFAMGFTYTDPQEDIEETEGEDYISSKKNKKFRGIRTKGSNK